MGSPFTDKYHQMVVILSGVVLRTVLAKDLATIGKKMSSVGAEKYLTFLRIKINSHI
jgi:hypothetical protein